MVGGEVLRLFSDHLHSLTCLASEFGFFVLRMVSLSSAPSGEVSFIDHQISPLSHSPIIGNLPDFAKVENGANRAEPNFG